MKRAGLLLLIGALLLSLVQPVRAQVSQEEVKANFVFRFISFVSWPAGTNLSRPVRLCVAGADPFARTLARVVAGQRAGSRTFQVERIAGGGDVAACDAVYVVGDRTSAVLNAARARPVLTITDSADNSERGIIHFALVEDRVRFYIDDANAAESGLSVDPRLLNLALAVRRRAPG